MCSSVGMWGSWKSEFGVVWFWVVWAVGLCVWCEWDVSSYVDWNIGINMSINSI